jgi:lauroyl/myristoyl acyltransferase
MTAPRTNSARVKKTPAVLRRDIILAAALPVLFPIAWFMPEKAKRALSDFVSTISTRLDPGSFRRNERRYCSAFDVPDKVLLYNRMRAVSYYEILQLLGLHAPGSKPPHISLQGYEFLERAYAAGKGAILWVAPTPFGPTLTKAALHSRGVALWHLSRPVHGFSPSRFAQAVLNPIRARAENRFLVRRIVIENGQVKRALEEIDGALAGNRAVSITMGVEAKIVQRIAFLRGTMTIALRPIELSRQCGAALLPVVTLRVENGEYTATIGAPLPVATDKDAIYALGQFLEPYAKAYPEQFAHAPVFAPPEYLAAGTEVRTP